ncbi:hypothetical protein EXS71_04235 [Candidatus Uhrbacteria bacterium]|nr:hypothetical protein [Candidatus Uhrbacteria bacterium]
MHGAICGMCHKPCEVPFMPNGKKPVYCASCFRKNERGESHAFEDRRAYSKPEYATKQESSGTANFNEQFKVLNEKLDAIIEALND